MRKSGNLSVITILIILGILISYINQMSPSPLLLILKDEFHIVNNDALLNLSISIMFPMLIIGSITGGIIEQKIGIRKLFILSMLLLTMGLLTNYLAVNYMVFLIGRMIYGIGFGLGVPFIGSAIMVWYKPEQREAMNTLNGLFPFIGTLICFVVEVPLYNLFGNSWRSALGFWGISTIFIGIIWMLLVKEPDYPVLSANEAKAGTGKNIYRSLLKNREIRLLSAIFMCDFSCYSYIAVILPTYLMEMGHMSEASAGLWSAIAFPAFGLVGCLGGGIITSSSRKRKPVLAAGQMIKFVGVLLATLGAGLSVWMVIIGIAMFGTGNGMWMPVMYNIPMELKDMNPSKVGATFALICSCGFACGFVTPTVGGCLTNLLMNFNRNANPVLNHVFGLQWSLFAFGFLSLLAFVYALLINETGPAKK